MRKVKKEKEEGERGIVSSSKKEKKERGKQKERAGDFLCQDTQGNMSASTFCQEEEKRFLCFVLRTD